MAIKKSKLVSRSAKGKPSALKQAKDVKLKAQVKSKDRVKVAKDTPSPPKQKETVKPKSRVKAKVKSKAPVKGSGGAGNKKSLVRMASFLENERLEKKRGSEEKVVPPVPLEVEGLVEVVEESLGEQPAALPPLEETEVPPADTAPEEAGLETSFFEMARFLEGQRGESVRVAKSGKMPAIKEPAPVKEAKKKKGSVGKKVRSPQQISSDVDGASSGVLGFVGDVGKGSGKLVSTVICGAFSAVGSIFLGAVRATGMGYRGVASLPARITDEETVQGEGLDGCAEEFVDDGEPLGAPFEVGVEDEVSASDEESHDDKLSAIMDSVLRKQKNQDR